MNFWAIKFNVMSTKEVGSLSLIRGYPGVMENDLGTTPIKKSARQHLSISDLTFSRKLYSDGIIVWNYFGLFCILCTLWSHKYRWWETVYDVFFKLGVAPSNYYVQWQPLQSRHNIHFRRSRNRSNHILMRRDVLHRYKERRRATLALQFRHSKFESKPTPLDCH